MAVCPPAPLLARELTGLDPVVPELRQACAAAAEWLVRSSPEMIAVAGPGHRTALWPADGRLNLAAFGPALGLRDEKTGDEKTGPALPLPLGLGARLPDEGGYTGPRLLQSVRSDEPTAACLGLGADLRTLGDRVGLLVMADGSACRSVRAPATWTRGAAAFDAALERAVRSGDLGPLRAMDQDLVRELRRVDRPGW